MKDEERKNIFKDDTKTNFDFGGAVKLAFLPAVLIGALVGFLKLFSLIPFLAWLFLFFLSPVSWFIRIAGAAWVGILAAKKNFNLTNTILAGAIYGLLVGIIDIIIVFIFYFTRMNIPHYLSFGLSLILVPIYSAVTGAIIALICKLIFSKKT